VPARVDCRGTANDAQLSEQSMVQHPQITLRYFDARGRAQPFRYLFAARGIAYSEDLVPLSTGGGAGAAWPAMKEDRSRVGPFHKLPVLHYGERTIAETLVIGAFLHRALGDQALLSDDDNLRHAMLVSSLYGDVVTPIAMLLWAEALYAGLDYASFVRGSLARIRGHLGRLETTLAEWGWAASARGRPVMLADCLLWEELDVAQHVFGTHAGLDQYPTLARLYAETPGRAAFKKVLAAHTAPVTGRGVAAEAEIIGRLPGLIAA
jgi:glutathione S-transferase